MHNYAGDPTNFPANVGLIDDSDTPNAGNFNVAPENLADRTAYLQRLVQQQRCFNWTKSLAPPTADFDGNNLLTFTYSHPVWDDYYGRWLMGCQYNSSDVLGTLMGSYNLLQWVQVKSLIVSPAGGTMTTIADPSTGDVLIIGVNSDPAGETTLYHPSTNTKSSYNVYPSFTLNQVTEGYAMSGSPDGWAFWSYNDSSHVLPQFFYNSGGSAHTWTTAAFSGYTDAANWKVQAAAYNPGASKQILLFPTGTNPAQYVSSTDGLTYTGRTMPAIGASGTITGAAYDIYRSLWWMISDTGSSSFKLWKSSDGIAWTLVSTISYPTSKGIAVDGDGNIYVLAEFGNRVFAVGGVPTRKADFRTLVSTDNGLTFKVTDMMVGYDSGYPADATYGPLVSTQSTKLKQVMWWSNGAVRGTTF